MLILKILAVWTIESIAQAILICLFLALPSPSEDGYRSRPLYDLLADFLILLWAMFFSPYLLFTGYLRIIWKSYRLWDYSAVAAVLAVGLLQLYSVARGGWHISSEQIVLHVACAITAFGCTFAGGWFIKKYLLGKTHF